MDYKAIGYKAGIELHAQFEGKKLFCNCPAIIKDSKPDFEVTRNLRSSASELGKHDVAALHEMKKEKSFIYQGYKNTTCLVELDEEPPHDLNQEALKTALQISLLLNCKPVENLQFMRKVVIDGSNVSGFQRTGLLANDGYIETSKGRVGIWKVLLEEEAAKKIEEKDNYKKYNLSRLGIAMVEIVTAPEIQDPEHAKEVAAKLGMIIKSVPGTKRGIGSIRQDVNVSIKGKDRTEIKGFQDYRNIPKVVEYEIKRKSKDKNTEAVVRKANADFTTTFLRPLPGSARMYPETDLPIYPITKELLNSLEEITLIDDKVEQLIEKHNLPEPIAREVVKNKINLEDYLKKYKLDAKTITNILIEIPKEIKRRFGLDSNKLKKENYEEVLNLLDKKDINKEAVIDIFKEIIKTGKYNLSNYQALDTREIEEKIKALVKKNPDAPFGGLMGDAMKLFRGKVDGKIISELIKKYK